MNALFFSFLACALKLAKVKLPATSTAMLETGPTTCSLVIVIFVPPLVLPSLGLTLFNTEVV